jgi:hypothetical protein
MIVHHQSIKDALSIPGYNRMHPITDAFSRRLPPPLPKQQQPKTTPPQILLNPLGYQI